MDGTGKQAPSMKEIFQSLHEFYSKTAELYSQTETMSGYHMRRANNASRKQLLLQIYNRTSKLCQLFDERTERRHRELLEALDSIGKRTEEVSERLARMSHPAHLPFHNQTDPRSSNVLQSCLSFKSAATQTSGLLPCDKCRSNSSSEKEIMKSREPEVSGSVYNKSANGYIPLSTKTKGHEYCWDSFQRMAPCVNPIATTQKTDLQSCARGPHFGLYEGYQVGLTRKMEPLNTYDGNKTESFIPIIRKKPYQPGEKTLYQKPFVENSKPSRFPQNTKSGILNQNKTEGGVPRCVRRLSFKDRSGLQPFLSGVSEGASCDSDTNINVRFGKQIQRSSSVDQVNHIQKGETLPRAGPSSYLSGENASAISRCQSASGPLSLFEKDKLHMEKESHPPSSSEAEKDALQVGDESDEQQNHQSLSSNSTEMEEDYDPSLLLTAVEIFKQMTGHNPPGPKFHDAFVVPESDSESDVIDAQLSASANAFTMKTPSEEQTNTNIPEPEKEQSIPPSEEQTNTNIPEPEKEQSISSDTDSSNKIPSANPPVKHKGKMPESVMKALGWLPDPSVDVVKTDKEAAEDSDEFDF